LKPLFTCIGYKNNGDEPSSLTSVGEPLFKKLEIVMDSEHENRFVENNKSWTDRFIDFGIFAGKIACQALIMSATSYAFSTVVPRRPDIEISKVPLRKIS
jgi:hypothetical protein